MVAGWKANRFYLGMQERYLDHRRERRPAAAADRFRITPVVVAGWDGDRLSIGRRHRIRLDCLRCAATIDDLDCRRCVEEDHCADDGRASVRRPRRSLLAT